MIILKMILGIVCFLLSFSAIALSNEKLEEKKTYKCIGFFFLLLAIILIVNF